MNRRILFYAWIILLICPLPSNAGSLAGFNLMRAPHARAAGMGAAYTAVSNDVGGFAYNPATLSSLKRNEASFLLESGLIDDRYANMLIGLRGQNATFGLMVGYYNSGSFELVKSNGTSSTVTGQKDFIAHIGVGKSIGRWDVGVAGKYINDMLNDQVGASAIAADVGMSTLISHRVRAGFALQNFGSRLSYNNSSYALPTIARMGLGVTRPLGATQTTLLVDAPYLIDEQQWHGGAGLEIGWGVVALRGGYQSGNQFGGFSMGAGVNINLFSVDYTVGFANTLNSRQQISVRVMFGGADVNHSPLAQSTPGGTRMGPIGYQSMRSDVFVASQSTESSSEKKSDALVGAPQKEAELTSEQRYRIYEIKEGDTLVSIAESQYGDKRMAEIIRQSNFGVVDDSGAVVSGMKIMLP